jgi:hypothetical protein
MLSNKIRMAQNSFVFTDNTFNPKNVPGNILYLRADSIVGLNNNDPVFTWTDTSGSSNNAIQGTEISKPLYKTGVLNGLPGILFDDVNDFMTSDATFGPSSPFTIFVLYNVLGTFTSSHRTIDGGINNWLIGPHQSYHRMYNGAFIEDGLSDTNFVYTTTITSGSSTTFRLNGTEIGSNGNIDGPGWIKLSAATESLNGHVIEVIGYTNALSGSYVALVENYLKTKYAL